MLKIKFHLIIYRYELILAIIVLLLTGSITVSSKDTSRDFCFQDIKCPYKIALTFDDGPHPYFTDSLISILRRNNVPATFFLVGRVAMEYPQLVEELGLAGHELEIHGFTHSNLAKLSDGAIVKELSLTRSVIEDITGKKCFFFRPPGGQYNAEVVKEARSIGQDMVLWSVFPKDHEVDDPNIIIKRVLEQAADGGVILLHSGREPTLEALPVIIKRLRERGFQFVTVMQLRSSAPSKQYVWLK
jgi:peptidoglycan-N-acetylglucosamine deacetylase